MSDLIDRQAAIEATWRDTGYTDAINAMTVMRERLEQLPAAQPEQKWIPCSERLPEEIGTYITTIDYGKYRLAAGQRFYHGAALGWEDECVIAWMPFPKPYKEENR